MVITATTTTATTSLDDLLHPVGSLLPSNSFVLQCDPDAYAGKAPETVKNILQYVDDKFYDDTIFHRVIKDFMIQGGGYNSMGRKPTRDPITNEAKNGLRNKRGTLAMARTGDPHSGTAQFFINHKDNSPLDYPGQDGWGYAVFGKLVDGMDVLDKIAKVKTGSGDLPEETVVIHRIVRVEE